MKIENEPRDRGYSEEHGHLSETEGKYQELFELISSPTAVFDANGICLLVNRAFSYLLGNSRDDLQDGGVKFWNLFFI